MIYFAQAEGVWHVKIGHTDSDDARPRIAQLKTGSPVVLNLIGTMPGDQSCEKMLHSKFAAYRLHGEWFKPVPELLLFIANVSKSNMEDGCQEELRSALQSIANAISIDGGAGRDANGGYVSCLTESVMGISAGLVKVAEALELIASAIRNHGRED